MKREEMIDKMIMRYKVTKQDLMEAGMLDNSDITISYIMQRILDMQEEVGMKPPSYQPFSGKMLFQWEELDK